MSERKSLLPRGCRGPDEDPWVKNGTEAWVVVVDEDREGRRSARRFALAWPVELATTGEWARVSDRTLTDTLADLRHELARRAGKLAELGGWATPQARNERTEADA